MSLLSLFKKKRRSREEIERELRRYEHLKIGGPRVTMEDSQLSQEEIQEKIDALQSELLSLSK